MGDVSIRNMVRSCGSNTSPKTSANGCFCPIHVHATKLALHELWMSSKVYAFSLVHATSFRQ